jgi:hypothetical protein
MVLFQNYVMQQCLHQRWSSLLKIENFILFIIQHCLRQNIFVLRLSTVVCSRQDMSKYFNSNFGKHHWRILRRIIFSEKYIASLHFWNKRAVSVISNHWISKGLNCYLNITEDKENKRYNIELLNYKIFIFWLW